MGLTAIGVSYQLLNVVKYSINMTHRRRSPLLHYPSYACDTSGVYELIIGGPDCDVSYQLDELLNVITVSIVYI